VTSPVPQYHELMWPTLTAIKALGGSGTVREIYERAVVDEGFSEAQQEVMTKDGRMTEIEYRLHWARTHLKGIGAIENSTRGVWSITEKGKTIDAGSMQAEGTKWRAGYKTRRAAAQVTSPSELGDPDEAVVPRWEDQLTQRLLSLPPDGFEQLAQRILREAGFVNVTVTGKSGDGGIDGVGTYRPTLVSFRVYFQCKRYRGAVGAGAVRDFRGAMAGRGEKGLLITTGSFTPDAQREAVRDGAPPVELIDGQQLCELLKRYGLGVETKERVVEDVTVHPHFFDEYDR